jgi:hypothetical protein
MISMRRFPLALAVLAMPTLTFANPEHPAHTKFAYPYKKEPKQLVLDQLPPVWSDPAKTDQKPVKLIAKETMSYSIAANQVYADETEEKIPFPATARERWVDVASAADERLGFAAAAWRRTVNGRQELVVAFRGTNFTQISDWTRGNLTTFRFLPWETQYGAALHFVRSLESKHRGVPIILIGHSLGGGLAEYCQRHVRNSKAIVFDPSPNQGRLYSIGQQKNAKRVLRLFEKGEILRPFRWVLFGWNKVAKDAAVEGVEARWINFRSGNPLLQHSMSNFSVDLVRLSALGGDESAKDIMEQMSVRRRTKGQRLP